MQSRHLSLATRLRRERYAVAKASHSSLVTRHPAFTLLELLVVIGIIAILLVAVIPAVTSLSKSSGRKGAVSNLLGAIEQARVQGIKEGRSAYVVFPIFTSGTPAALDRYSYKSYAIFEDDPAVPTTPKQLTNWKTLPTGISLRYASLTALTDPASLMPPLGTITFTPDTTATQFKCLKFNANGEIESPPGNVSLSLFEGHVNGAVEVVTGSRDANGNPAATETINIAHLTGRATSTQ